MDEAQRDAGDAVRDGRWEEAVKHASYVASVDPERGAALRGEVIALLRASLEALLREQHMERAYPLAVRALRIDRKMDGLDDVFTRLREHYLAESEQRTAAISPMRSPLST